jgi:serine/threonine-protein kinase RsbW
MAAMSTSSQHEGGSSVTLDFHGASVRTARERLRTELGSRCTPARVEDARMVVSELVANSLRYARPLAGHTIAVGWTVHPDALRLSVTDGGSTTTAPRQRRGGELATGGRGLQIVESLARRWGVESEDAGTTVWAELDLS